MNTSSFFSSKLLKILFTKVTNSPGLNGFVNLNILIFYRKLFKKRLVLSYMPEGFIEKQIGKVVGNAAAKIASDINANCVISVAQKEKSEFEEESSMLDVRITIFRKDNMPVESWYDMWNIKNKIWGDEVLAVEIYPKRSELIDGCNQRHLFKLNIESKIDFGNTSQLKL